MYGHVFQAQNNSYMDQMLSIKIDVCNIMSSFDSLNLMS